MEKQKSVKWLLAVIATILVFGSIGYGTYQKLQTPTNDREMTAPQAPTSEQKNTTAEQQLKEKEVLLKKTGDGKTDPGSPAPIPVGSDTIDLTARKDNNATVTILTQLKGYASGVCQLDIANGSKKITASADIIYQPEYSTCAGFSVAIDSLGAGMWQIKVTATPSGGASNSRQISYEVGS